MKELAKETGYLLLKIAGLAAACLLMATFVFGIHRCRDDSMEPAVKYGDLIVYYRLNKSYVSSECVVIKQEGREQVRRVIAVAGDTVNLTEEGLLVNGALIQENGIYEKTDRYEEGIAFPVTVGENQVFVLGDNRKSAKDSRIYGCIDMKNILGKAVNVLRRRDI